MTLNHIWSEQEIQERLENLYQHRPKTLSDKIMHRILSHLYICDFYVLRFVPVAATGLEPNDDLP